MRIRMSLKVRRCRAQLQALARDGMRGTAAALLVMLLAFSPGQQAKLAIVLGLAGIFCARVRGWQAGKLAARAPRSAAGRRVGRSAARPPAARPQPGGPRHSARKPSRKVRLGTYSSECLDGDCEACDGAGCDDTCGHPGRSRSRTPRRGGSPVGAWPVAVPDEPPF